MSLLRMGITANCSCLWVLDWCSLWDKLEKAPSPQGSLPVSDPEEDHVLIHSCFLWSSRRSLERCCRTRGHFLASKETFHCGSLFSRQSHCMLARHAFPRRPICRAREVAQSGKYLQKLGSTTSTHVQKLPRVAHSNPSAAESNRQGPCGWPAWPSRKVLGQRENVSKTGRQCPRNNTHAALWPACTSRHTHAHIVHMQSRIKPMNNPLRYG